jgi:purine-binding chemotaxis protein CheW
MSRVDLVVFVIDGQRYALALGAVERVLPMVAVSPLPAGPAIALGVINVHGTVVPVVDVRRRFGLPARDFGVTTRLLIARAGRRTLAIPADEVLGVVEVASEGVVSTNALLEDIGHVAGVVALVDGLLFIHDLDAFLSPDEERRLSEALGGTGT